MVTLRRADLRQDSLGVLVARPCSFAHFSILYRLPVTFAALLISQSVSLRPQMGVHPHGVIVDIGPTLLLSGACKASLYVHRL